MLKFINEGQIKDCGDLEKLANYCPTNYKVFFHDPLCGYKIEINDFSIDMEDKCINLYNKGCNGRNL